jgi:hypothetical protein
MNRSSSILIAIILVFTFPLWFGLGMGFIGLVFGLIGGAIGIVVGLFGAVIGVFAGIFNAIFHGIFGWGHHGSFFPHMHFNGFFFLCMLIVVALLISKRNKN